VTAATPDPTSIEDAIIEAWCDAGYVRDDEDPDVPTVHAWVHQAARVAAEAVAARVAEARAEGRAEEAERHMAATVANTKRVGELRAEADEILAAVAAVADENDALLAVLRELVRLKDGPRDAAYERDKPKAWDAARAVVADAGSAS
jgi:hypothetical protein